MSEQNDRILTKASLDSHKAGLRWTEKRANILHTLLENAVPMSAYEVTEHYNKQFKQKLSTMSAYRMLSALIDANLVHKLASTNQYLACAHITCQHAHKIPQFLICDQCHSVQELGLPEHLIQEIKTSIHNTGFNLHKQQLELHGLCQQCTSGQ